MKYMYVYNHACTMMKVAMHDDVFNFNMCDREHTELPLDNDAF